MTGRHGVVLQRRVFILFPIYKQRGAAKWTPSVKGTGVPPLTPRNMSVKKIWFIIMVSAGSADKEFRLPYYGIFPGGDPARRVKYPCFATTPPQKIHHGIRYHYSRKQESGPFSSINGIFRGDPARSVKYHGFATPPLKNFTMEPVTTKVYIYIYR